MKTIFAIALVAFVAFVYSQEEYNAIKCPPVNEGNATLFPHPKNCHHYFVCNWGIPVAMECPPGLHFNAKEMACDWPWRANCTRGLMSE